MEIYRLTRAKYAQSLSGKGAAIQGGRWNSMGIEMIYCAANKSLAMAEVAVHFSLATLPADYIMLTIHVPKSIQQDTILEDDLPENWNIFPSLPNTQKIGDLFVEKDKFALFKVPSVVTQGDFNYLINPRHKSFSKIKIVSSIPFKFDRRLFI